MANGVITTALPSYAGQIFTSDPTATPFLAMIGGLNGGKVTQNFEFITGQLYNVGDPTIPGHSEIDSLTAPDPSYEERAQKTNVTQIFHETVAISYVKQSNRDRLSGLNSANQQANPQDELAWQTDARLKRIAHDMEKTFLYGEYRKSTGTNVANQTRGMFASIDTNVVDANGGEVTYEMLQALYLSMAENGATFTNLHLFCSPYNKQKITDLYKELTGFQLPPTRTVGGANVQDVVFDFGTLSIVWSRFVKNSEIGLFDMRYVDAVMQPVPGKGNFFREELARTGAGETHQIFGQGGLDHGPDFVHGKIINLGSE